MKNGIDLSGLGASGQIVRNNYFYSCGVYIIGEMLLPLSKTTILQKARLF